MDTKDFVKEMEENPCIFVGAEYDSKHNMTTMVCTLTTTRVSEKHPRYSKACRPNECPIWKTYVMLLKASQKISIKKEEVNNDKKKN